eukprot:Skav200477  [mRNA]  locus=scaffold5182:225944:227719:+ [translate_table: standard]
MQTRGVLLSSLWGTVVSGSSLAATVVMAKVEEKQVATEPSKEPEQPVKPAATGLTAGEEKAVLGALKTQLDNAETLAEEATSTDGTSEVGPDAETQVAVQPAPVDGNTQVVPATMPGTPSEMSAVGEPQALPVEAFNWQQLQLDSKHYCHNCKKPVEANPTQVVRKKGHQQLSCKMCHKVTTMLYKNLHLQSSGWKELSQEQMTDFYLNAGKMAAHSHGLQWSKLKGLLQDKLVESETHRRTAAVRGKFLPLSVWTKKGYDGEAIVERAEKQKSDLFGYVYRVPVLEIGYEHVEEEVRSRILEATKKMAKGKRKSEAIEGEDEEEDLFGSEENQERLKDWESIDSSDEGKAKKGSTGSRAASSKAAGKAKAKAKARAKCSQEEKDAARKANGSIVAAARRGVRLLETANKEAKKATKFIHCPDDLKEEASALAAILKECKQVVNNHAKSTAEGKILDELSMDCDAMKELAKSVKSKADSTCAMAKTLHSMDDAALEKLAEAAKRSREAKNVD